ncbi:MAG TPA: hypothetical protein PK264_02985, partial [Hyphomicrobiaceae bacterium]|nr:hypothetical protein [Hyphomicrobiaceae bacterium]
MLLICLGLTASFAYHIRHGRHGLEARSTLLARSAALELRVHALETVRARLARDIALLGAAPDRDLVSELAQELVDLLLGAD